MLMTVRVPPAVTTSRAMALPGTMSRTSRTSSAANTSARRAIKSPPPTHGGGRSDGPYADSLPLPDHFQGGGGGGWVWGGGGREGACQERGRGEAS